MTDKSSIIIRDIAGISEMREVEELQKEVWGISDRDLVPLTQLAAAKEVGGVLIGAFDGAVMVGFAYGFIGHEGGRPVLHSHMLAVKPAYRNLDLGYQLKLAQRERALAQGLTRMTWTFDPLQSLNAYFNFSKLGVVADCYKINFYGEETSSFLHRLGTDRLWVSWLLDSQRVRQRLDRASKAEPVSAELESAMLLVQVAADSSPRRSDLMKELTSDRVSIEIPGDIGAVHRQSPELAGAWREATRMAFTEALAAGYLVEEFCRVTRNDQRLGAYLLSFGKKL